MKSKDELFQKNDELEKEKGFCQAIWVNRIVMNEQFDTELDFFTITRIDSSQYISERLKNAIEANGITDWTFTPDVNLVVE